MTLNAFLIFTFGVVVLYLVHVLCRYFKKNWYRQKFFSYYPQSSKPAAQVVDIVPDWGFACNQLCLELYGVDHPSAFLTKTVDFWREEFMSMLGQIKPWDAVLLLDKLNEREAAFSEFCKRNPDLDFSMLLSAEQLIRYYLQQIKK